VSALVIDSSFAAAALAGVQHEHEWAERQMGVHDLIAPEPLPVEVAHTLRGLVHRGRLDEQLAAAALQSLLDLPVEYYGFAPFGCRVWELRDNVTPYDAWYVALAEASHAPLATLDQRLARAPGVRCRFLTVPSSM
jgi:predicted nucleic acid-binding protein